MMSTSVCHDLHVSNSNNKRKVVNTTFRVSAGVIISMKLIRYFRNLKIKKHAEKLKKQKIDEMNKLFVIFDSNI